MKQTFISCPNCGWEPDGGAYWVCSDCKTMWNTFDTAAKCPTCSRQYDVTVCPRRQGGCGQVTPHKDWYTDHRDDLKPKSKSVAWMFWKKKQELPVTANDKRWIEEELLWLAEYLEPARFKTLSTIVPGSRYLNRTFAGTEDDAEDILKSLAAIMNVESWELQLMFFSEKPTKFSEGITATPSDKLKQRWIGTPSKTVDKGLGNKEIWIDLEHLSDEAKLITTLSHELARFKLLEDYPPEEVDDLLIAMMALSFGFGIFMGNSYFKFAQWHGNTHHGWQMQKDGYLPEQVIAYAMAWLAYYRNEDTSWKQCLNKTTLKYFEQSYNYITGHPDQVNW